ncbi:calymmin [Halichoeres trimaculatus]|uniref:calymmin n=1 Tax=Halichoeres trimaculatus TaxID=147232 RepID=UPI003D9DC0E3
MQTGGRPQTRVYIRPSLLGRVIHTSFTLLILTLLLGPNLFSFGSTMWGQILLQGTVVLWLVQAAHTGGYGGYGATSGVANGQGPQLNGRNGGGIGRMLMPSKGVGQAMGAGNGYGGYPTKGMGYGAAAGVTNGGGLKGRHSPHGNGANSNGHGAQAGPVNGQQVKGNGYGAQAGGYNGQKVKGNGNGASAGVGGGAKPNGHGAAAGGLGMSSNGYGAKAGPVNGQQMKGNGYGAQAGGYVGQATKGNGNSAAAGSQNGFGTKGYGTGPGLLNGNGVQTNGQGAVAGPTITNGAGSNGQGAAGNKPMKGFGRPRYGTGPGVGMGGLGVPHLAANQGYGSNGYNGHGAKPMGGSNGGFGRAGLGLGPRFGNGGIKGPNQGYGGAAGNSNGQGVKNNGYAQPSGGATKPAKPGYGHFPGSYGANGYGSSRGSAMRPSPGFGNGALSNGYGAKPNGYGPGAGAGAGAYKGNGAKSNGHGTGNGAALGAYGATLNGFGVPSGASTPQNNKGVGAVSPTEGAKSLGNGYGGPAVTPNGQLAKTGNSGYGTMPYGKSLKNAGATNGKGLKGQVLSPEQPSVAPEEEVPPYQGVTQGAAPVPPEPTSGIIVMVTQEQHQMLPSPVPQGKSYKHGPLIPLATQEPALVIPLHPEPEATLEPAPKGSKTVISGPVSVDLQTVPAAPEPEAVLPEGKYQKHKSVLCYVTGDAVPEQKGAVTDALFGGDSNNEGEAAPESTKSVKTKAVPETVSATSKDTIAPEEALAVAVPVVTTEETNIKSQPQAGPERPGVKGQVAGETGATDNGGVPTKAQGSKPASADCGPSGVPNGQWMKIPRPGYNGGVGASAGTNTKGFGAGAGVPNGYGSKVNGNGVSAGGYSNGGGAKANKPSYGARGYAVPGLNNGYGAGPRYPYTGKPQQPSYGQRAYLGAGYGNENPHGGNRKGNGFNAGVQPDFASLGQGASTAYGKSGAKQSPYSGAVVPSGLDGLSKAQPQSAGHGPKNNGMYGGMGGLPNGGQPLGMGAKKSNAKYGIGGLQFGGQPLSQGTDGAGSFGYGGSPYKPAGNGKSNGQYGGQGARMGGNPAPGKYGYGGLPNGGQVFSHGSNGHTAGKYGYGRMPYEAQLARLSPGTKSSGKYGPAAAQYQPTPLGFGQNGKLSGNYGGGEVPNTPEALGFHSQAKSSSKYGNQQPYQSQPLEAAPEVRPDTAGLYEPQPQEPDSDGKSYRKGAVPTPGIAVEGEGMPIDRYEDVGYINGQVQPEVVNFPAAPTPSPTLAYPLPPSNLPMESSLTPDVSPGLDVEDLPDPAGTTGLSFDSAPSREAHGEAQASKQPEDQQLPRQIHIQQHLKLHFHQQGAKNGKFDMNGFVDNSGYQG